MRKQLAAVCTRAGAPQQQLHAQHIGRNEDELVADIGVKSVADSDGDAESDCHPQFAWQLPTVQRLRAV